MSETTTETHNAYVLAGLAESGSPDERDSAGATFLLGVASAVGEMLDYKPLAEGMDASEYADEISELADSAVPVYTHTIWTTFVDLAAYQEDPTELADMSDIQGAAKVCLYIIAERLAYALLNERIEALADADSE